MCFLSVLLTGDYGFICRSCQWKDREQLGYVFVSLNLVLEMNKKVLKIPGKISVHYSVL